MAIGRRDYTWGFLSEAATEGRYTESFFKSFLCVVSPASSLEVYSYTVPEDYKLAVNRVMISTNSKVTNVISITFGSLPQFLIHFSENYCFTVSDQNPIYLLEGEILKIIVNNVDEIEYWFIGSIIGALESLIS